MNKIREFFPMLKKDFIYLNNAATSLKPKQVIDTFTDYYSNYGVNTNRGIDSLGYKVTQKYESVRDKTAKFIGAKREEIIFTRGTTDSINMIARMLESFINEGDEIIVSVLEHHSNYLPWQQLCIRKNATLKVLDVDENGLVRADELNNIISNKTKVVAINHMSNVMGGINDLAHLAEITHQVNAYFVVDGAQGIIHELIDVSKTAIDFYAFSAHKMYGPMGLGVLYGKQSILNNMTPVIFGGEMIGSFNSNQPIYKETPYKFEAGTMMVPEVLAFGQALDFINEVGFSNMHSQVKVLRQYLVDKLSQLEDIIIYNKNNVDSGIITFNIKNIHAHDIATLLDQNNIIVRAGHHCAEPFMQFLKIPATVRISLSFYNTVEECDKVIEVLKGSGDYINVLFK